MPRFTDLPHYFAGDAEPTTEQANEFLKWLQLNNGNRCFVNDWYYEDSYEFIQGVYNMILFHNGRPIPTLKLRPLFERFPHMISLTFKRCIEVCSGAENWCDYLLLLALIKPSGSASIEFSFSQAADECEKFAKIISILRSNGWYVSFSYYSTANDDRAVERILMKCDALINEVAKLRAENTALRTGTVTPANEEPQQKTHKDGAAKFAR